SDMNFLVYDRTGQTIGVHRDTNPLSVVVYLTTGREGATRCRLLKRRCDERARYVDVFPEEGNVLVMQGRKVLHKGLPVVSETKVVAVWNYYYKADVWRPNGFDALLYGGGRLLGRPIAITGGGTVTPAHQLVFHARR